MGDSDDNDDDYGYDGDDDDDDDDYGADDVYGEDTDKKTSLDITWIKEAFAPTYPTSAQSCEHHCHHRFHHHHHHDDNCYHHNYHLTYCDHDISMVHTCK